MKYKLVYIEWQDATNMDGWKTKETIEGWMKSQEKDAGWAEQVGWIIKETKRYLILSALHAKENDYQMEQFAHLQKIPKTWIRKRKVLKI